MVERRSEPRHDSAPEPAPCGLPAGRVRVSRARPPNLRSIAQVAAALLDLSAEDVSLRSRTRRGLAILLSYVNVGVLRCLIVEDPASSAQIFCIRRQDSTWRFSCRQLSLQADATIGTHHPWQTLLAPGSQCAAWSAPLHVGERHVGALVAQDASHGTAPRTVLRRLRTCAPLFALAWRQWQLESEVREGARRLAAAEAQLAQAQLDLVEAFRSRHQFLSNVTHELKRPLAPARLVMETLLEAPPGKLPPHRQERLLRNALGNLDSLNNLISELLDAVRLQYGAATAASRPVDLCAVARRSLRALRSAAAAKHLQVRAVIPSAAVPVSGDADALNRVVTNLLSNAVKFNREGGSILLQLERIGETQAILSVTDTGIGIPPAARPHVFERFFQADSSSTRTYEGMGLGLYIAREIVRQHGGDIRFDSAEGVGSTFTVLLPLLSATLA